MTGAAGSTGSSGSTGVADERLSRVFLGIVLMELLSIAGLLWAGMHFAR